MKTAHLFFISVTLIFIFSACQQGKKATDSSEGASTDPTEIKLTALKDSIDKAWVEMITDDDEKIFSLERLLDEITYTNNFYQVKIEQLRKDIENLKATRYNQQNMARSELIDKYDSLTNETIQKVVQYAQKHPQYLERPIMEELIRHIYNSNSNVLLYRVYYDRFAKEYNTVISKNKNLKPIPLFELPG